MNLVIKLNDIVDKRKKSQITLPFGDKEDLKVIHLKVDVSDDEVNMYSEALFGAVDGDEESRETHEVEATINALKALTREEDAALWDDFRESTGAGLMVFRSVFQDVQAKFFEAKTGKDSEDAK